MYDTAASVRRSIAMLSIPLLFETYAAVRILLDLARGDGSLGLDLFVLLILAVLASYSVWRIRFLLARLRDVE